ncbi:MAG: hypothetical protein AB2989_07050 [Candidatus Symbiodolus clandestinus]
MVALVLTSTVKEGLKGPVTPQPLSSSNKPQPNKLNSILPKALIAWFFETKALLTISSKRYYSAIYP